MSGASKYTFDVEFRPQGDLVSNAARARQKKSYTIEEIDQLSARAREQGMKAGQVRAAEALAAETARLAKLVGEMLESAQRTVAELREEAALLALAAARKLAAAAIARLPAADVEQALRAALHQAIGEPRLVLHASQRAVDVLKPQLDDIARQEGFEGRLAIVADPAMANGDCRIDWRGGGSERCESAIEKAIGELIARHFSNPMSKEE